jgi:two-component system, NarL family, invasion response regulator UvrY
MSGETPLRILLVDDHPVVRRGVAGVIVDSYPHAVIKEVDCGADALASVRAQPWELVILDLTLPDSSGLEVLKQIRNAQPGVTVLILSIHPAADFVRRVMAAGAAGYLTKSAASTQLTQAIFRLINGDSYFGDQAPTNVPPAPLVNADDHPHERLSDREYEVLRLLGQGLTVSEVAQALTLSVKTVSTYRTRLMIKMDMRTNAELVHYAIRTGLSRV